MNMQDVEGQGRSAAWPRSFMMFHVFLIEILIAMFEANP